MAESIACIWNPFGMSNSCSSTAHCGQHSDTGWRQCLFSTFFIIAEFPILYCFAALQRPTLFYFIVCFRAQKIHKRDHFVGNNGECTPTMVVCCSCTRIYIGLGCCCCIKSFKLYHTYTHTESVDCVLLLARPSRKSNTFCCVCVCEVAALLITYSVCFTLVSIAGTADSRNDDSSNDTLSAGGFDLRWGSAVMPYLRKKKKNQEKYGS